MAADHSVVVTVHDSVFALKRLTGFFSLVPVSSFTAVAGDWLGLDVITLTTR